MSENNENEPNDLDQRFKYSEKMEKYRLELASDIKLSVSNIREKSLQSSSLRCKWLNYYMVEKSNLSRIKKAKEKYLKKKMPSSSSSILSLKSQDKLSENDEMLIRINTLSEETKEIIDYLQQVMNIMNDFGFQIKNAIEIFKLERM